MNDVNSLSHTKWNCKYRIAFWQKYRREVFYGEKRKEMGEILRTLCNWKKVKIVEAEVYLDHIHMLLKIPPKVAISSFIGYLEGKSSLMIYEKYPELKPGHGKPSAMIARGIMKLAHALPWTCGGASHYCEVMTAEATGGLGRSPVPRCVANTAQAFINMSVGNPMGTQYLRCSKRADNKSCEGCGTIPVRL